MPHDDMTREAAEEILGLPRRYTKEDLRHAYTQQARTYHPDAAARSHFDPSAAQKRMVEANKAYQRLKRQFAHNPDLVVERYDETTATSSVASDAASSAGTAGGTSSYAEVDWNAYAREADRAARAARAARARQSYAAREDNPADASEASGFDDPDDPWGFADEWGADPVPQKVPLSVRSVLLGPVLLRIVAIALLAWVWWRNFPLLSHNTARFSPEGAWALMDVARLVAAMVYPTYFLVYEALTGFLSGLVREVLNGAVSWVVGRYVDLRPKSASFGCSLSKILREQLYALLMTPVVLYLAAMAVSEDSVIPKIMLGVLAVIFLVDTLAACTNGGFVNIWSSALAERVEARYLLIRAALLRRCGQWDGR